MFKTISNIDIPSGTRLCRVDGKYGFFHTWELYSQPVEASPFVGGAPAGVFNRVYGIVEFEDDVRRVDPTHIEFCDKCNAILYNYNEHDKENKNVEI